MNTQGGGVNGAVTFIGAWLLVVVFGVALANTGWGKTIVYYVLWLAVILLVLGQGQEISNMLNAAGIANKS